MSDPPRRVVRVNQTTDLQETLDRLVAEREGQVVEFKAARNQYNVDKLGRYFAALANEANLAGADSAWIVLGVDDSGMPVGTQFIDSEQSERQFRMDIQTGTSPTSGFRGIFELVTSGKRVLLMEVPPTPRGIPMAWKGHYYARDGENLVALSMDKLEEIRYQTLWEDWTAVPVRNAGIENLDEEALAKARREFAVKHPEAADDIAGWSTEEFLARAHLIQDGGITRAALLLLGDYSATGFLNPHLSWITWRLLGEEEGYEHFKPPFILNTSKVFQRIRNVELKLMRPGTLFSEILRKYEERVILEAIHNALAHQDYRQNSRIVVTEYIDRVEIESVGGFFDGQPEEYVTTTRTPKRYRNPFLVEAMGNLGMIETMGYGIRMMTTRQRERFLPLPDYDLTDPARVKVTIYGRVVDEAYTRLLMERSDLPLADVLALDRVQKGLLIKPDVRRRLRDAGLVEGRSPHLQVSARIAEATDRQAEYMRTRALDDAHYERLILDYLDKFGSATRRDLEALLLPKLSDALDDKQKQYKLTNLVAKMKRNGLIQRIGSRTAAQWERV